MRQVMRGRRTNIFAGGVLLAVVVIVSAGGWFWFSRTSGAFRTAAPLDLPAFASSANSLRGNTYKIEGEVAALLAWSPTGRLVSVQSGDGNKVVPLLLPEELNATNIQKGMKFRFLLLVDDQGIPRVTKLAKL